MQTFLISPLAYIRLAVFALIVLSSLQSCDRHSGPVPFDGKPIPNEPPSIEYLMDEDNEADDSTSLFEPYEMASPNARAAASGKLVIEYLNNETEIFRPSSYTVNMWRSDAEPSSDATPSTRPTYIVRKSSARSYVRKTVKAGWYIAQFIDGQNFKFLVAEGSNGLLIYNENSFSSPFRGYFPIYGKMKVGWKVKPSHEENTVLTFSQGGAKYSDVWVYAQDGAKSNGGQFWFMPVGTYSVSYLLRAVSGSTTPVNVTVAAGKVYPYLKITR